MGCGRCRCVGGVAVAAAVVERDGALVGVGGPVGWDGKGYALNGSGRCVVRERIRGPGARCEQGL